MTKIHESLLPCPFCGKAPHVSQVAGGMMASCDPCMIDKLVPEWNRRAPFSAGKMKPLVWGENADTSLDCAWVDDFGIYQITDEHILFIGHASDGVCFDTLDAAKAAAQADYEARILSQFGPGDGWQGE